jgi:integrase
MSKIIDINSNSDFKFVAVPIRIDWMEFRNKKEIEKKHLMVICVKNIKTDCLVIHPLSEFILKKWSNHKYLTIKKHAYTTVSFLNFLLLVDGKLKINNLAELDISHGDAFLTHMYSNEKTYGTQRDAEYTLVQLYHFLSVQELLIKIPLSKFETNSGQYGSYLKTPFNPVRPTIKPVEKIHLLPYQYIPMFLEIVISEAHPILLGIYFQIFGGIRLGEVLNIRRSSIRVKPTGDMIINLQNHDLRNDLKTASASVKQPRFQKVIAIHDWLDIFYENHLIEYKQEKSANALFVNRDGKAMTEGTYRYYFGKAKIKFIEELKKGGADEALLAYNLENSSWSTHIGRGTFTNLIAEVAELQFARGDKNPNSSFPYLFGTDRMNEKIKVRFQNVHVDFIPLLMKRGI